ncbi:MAG: TonB-dependent receptor [Steroidobacteraceae bacterium]
MGGHGPGTSTATDYSVASDPSGYTQNYYLSYRIFTQLDTKMGPGTLTFIPSYQYATGYNWSTGMGAFAKSVDPKDAKQKSADLRYVATTDANWQWATGLYFYDKNDVGDAFGGTAYGTTRSYAGYVNLTYPITDATRLIGGVRESSDKKTYRLVDAGGGETNGSDSRTTFDWKAGVESDLTNASRLYLTVATGHRPGGFNILADNTAPLTTPGSFYKPESLLSYEVGTKNRFLDDRLQLNGAVFFYDYKDYQLADIYSFVGGLHAEFINANAQIKGAELEAQALLGHGTKLDAGVTYLDGKLTQDVTRTLSGVTTTVFRDGDTLSHSPKLALRVGLDHEFALTHGSLTPRVAYRYTDKQYVNAVNNDANLQDAYTGSDASLTYKSEDGKWTVNAYCNNLSDKQVKTFLAGPTPQVSDPRTYGVVFNAKF